MKEYWYKKDQNHFRKPDTITFLSVLMCITVDQLRIRLRNARKQR